jgi:hypothetical protein
MPDGTTKLGAIDAANLLAGRVVAAATAFLDGRHDADRLAQDASRLQTDLIGFDDPVTNPILMPARLIVVAMMGTASAARAALTDGAMVWRQERWENVTASLIELIRHESRSLRDAELRRELDELEAANTDATEWSAAVAVRDERIAQIKRVLSTGALA